LFGAEQQLMVEGAARTVSFSYLGIMVSYFFSNFFLFHG